MQTTTWTKSDINPSDGKPWKPPSSTDQTETISDSEKDADENETEQFDCWSCYMQHRRHDENKFT